VRRGAFFVKTTIFLQKLIKCVKDANKKLEKGNLAR
jgi:hypothetical protein